MTQEIRDLICLIANKYYPNTNWQDDAQEYFEELTKMKEPLNKEITMAIIEDTIKESLLAAHVPEDDISEHVNKVCIEIDKVKAFPFLIG